MTAGRPCVPRQRHTVSAVGVHDYVARGPGRLIDPMTHDEVRLLTGRDPKDPKWIDSHAGGLVAILLPGLRR